MIPTETSTNLRSAMVCARAERGIRTMIARVMLAQRYAVFSKRNAIDSKSDENNRKREWERKPAAPSLLRLRANAQFTSRMAVDFLRLYSRSAGRSHIVPGSHVVRGVVPCHCRAWIGGLCCRVR